MARIPALIARFALPALLSAALVVGAPPSTRAAETMSEQDAAKMKARMVEKIGKHLDLDSGQKAKLGALADKLREQQLALRGKGADPRAELQGLVAGPTFDRATATALIDAKLGAISTKSPEVVLAMGDFYDSLKPDQQAKVREFLARHGGGHHHG